MNITSGTDLDLMSNEADSAMASKEFLRANPRISNLMSRFSYYVQDIMQIKLASTQLVHNVLDEAIRICMVFYGKDPPLPSRLLVFDPNDVKDRDQYDDMGFDVTIRQKIETLIGKFIKQWVHKRRRLKYSLRLYRHWTTKKVLHPLPETQKNTAKASVTAKTKTQPFSGDSVEDADRDNADASDDKDAETSVKEDGNDDVIVEHTYVYEAKFSAPTRQCPTPQCTASVFFWIHVAEFDWTQVRQPIYESYRYQFEGRVYMHKPSIHGHPYDFQEGILLEILEHKYKLFDSLDF